MASISRFTALTALLLALGACTTSKTEPPAPSGPSELGTSLQISVSPDLLPQDGQSTSQVTVRALDANSQPVRNLGLRIEIAVGNVVTDFGSLSSKDVSTGADGRAVVVYRAPAPVDSVDRDTRVQIFATPVGTNHTGTYGRFAEIRLVPTGTVGGETPVPAFTMSPENPQQLQTVTFDASDPRFDASLVSCEWNFGDGSKGSGRAASHQYRSAGNFVVTLTVTDLAGRKGSRSRNITVGSSGLPTASFVFSPTNPGVGQAIAFNASASAAVAPRTIVSYDWQFGTDRTGSGMVVTKQYDTPGTYNVTLTVTDDAGNKATTTQSVPVGTASPGGLSAQFTVSPTDPRVGTAVQFNASSSTSSSDPIVEYQWDFGDGGTAVSGSPTSSHSYTTAAGYVVTLRVKDSANRTALITKNVTVSP